MFGLEQGVELILASGSPRRRDLLRELGFEFKVEVADVDEALVPGEAPQLMVERLAKAKAESIAEKYPKALVLGADTTVVLGSSILGKPTSPDDAADMLGKLAGREHTVWTAFALVLKSRSVSQVSLESSQVKIAPLSKPEIEAYVATKEPLDKAGSYAVQGKGAAFVEAVHGSYSNVVGLPVHALVRELKLLGLLRTL